MVPAGLRAFRLGEILPLTSIPVLPVPEFRSVLLSAVGEGGRVISFFSTSDGEEGSRLWAFVAFDTRSCLGVATTSVAEKYPALTPECPQVHVFEREIAEQTGIQPLGHPDLRPVRFPPRRVSAAGGVLAKDTLPGVFDHFSIGGSEVHEVAVGPVHAGIIEPGHFRFQCHGEDVLHLEISLGYQHRGVEKALVGGPNKRTVHYLETLAGDTTIGHTLAYCQMVENLSGAVVPARYQALRAVALELERLANHTGDLGALANDVAFLPTAAYCGRIRGDFLNMTALLCGNRFGRSLLQPGGMLFEVDDGIVGELTRRLASAEKDLTGAVELFLETPSVLERLEGTGVVDSRWVDLLGLVGPSARAVGRERDVRLDFPSGIYRLAHLPISTYPSGDVFARACVRWLEAQRSLGFIQDILSGLPAVENNAVLGHFPPRSLAVTLVEGWRGEICHVAITDAEGAFRCYKIVDPSFHNWTALAIALRGEQISNFPLCNKSFNLSYCGFDL